MIPQPYGEAASQKLEYGLPKSGFVESNWSKVWIKTFILSQVTQT